MPLSLKPSPSVVPPVMQHGETDELQSLRHKNRELINYIRAKTDRLLQVMGTVPLRVEELDDDTLLAVDPIGIVSDAFEQVLEHLQQMNRDLTYTRDELQAVFNAAGAGIVVVNPGMEVTACNHYSQQQLFNGETEVLGRNLRNLLCTFEEECILEQILATGDLVERKNFQHNDRVYHLVGTPIKAPDGSVMQMVLFYTDITERILAAQEIERLAFFDSLTGLPNRVLLKDRLSQMIHRAARTAEQVAVLFIDLDRFKEINDTLGHSNGDRVLQMVAERLSGSLRNCDTVARLGGDEFVVLLEGISDRQAVSDVVGKLLQTLAQPFMLDMRELCSGASVGVAIYPEDGSTVEVLFQNADVAMYHAKEQGRNRFSFYAEGMQASAFETLTLSSDLRHAFERGECSLVYQPQIELATGRLVGVEALLRWQHPVLGEVAPQRVIPIAENIGMMPVITAWILETACRQVRDWSIQESSELRVAVNLTAGELDDPMLAGMVQDALQHSGLPARLLELELTERMLIENFASARDTLQALKSLGVTLAIDDFGIGYSSLSYLRHFPVSRVKLDMSFVQDIAEQSDDAALVVDALVALAHSLHLHVLAERVEHADQVSFLMQRKCDELQGFYISKPLTAHEFGRLLKHVTQSADFCPFYY